MFVINLSALYMIEMKIPDLEDMDLAYETGLHIGDGSLCIDNKSTHRLIYYGNNKTEREFFNKVIIPLIERLYGFRPRLENFENSCFIRIGSKELVEFKSKILGLPIGNKEKLISLPKIFLSNKELLCNLLAGIFDTDGSICKNRRKYPRISLVLKNELVINEIRNILLELDITSTIWKSSYFDKRINKTEIRWYLYVNGIKNFKLFMNKIKLRNPNHLNRIKRFNFSEYSRNPKFLIR